MIEMERNKQVSVEQVDAVEEEEALARVEAPRIEQDRMLEERRQQEEEPAMFENKSLSDIIGSPTAEELDMFPEPPGPSAKPPADESDNNSASSTRKRTSSYATPPKAKVNKRSNLVSPTTPKAPLDQEQPPLPKQQRDSWLDGYFSDATPPSPATVTAEKLQEISLESTTATTKQDIQLGPPMTPPPNCPVGDYMELHFPTPSSSKNKQPNPSLL
jgi:hypothetical protein